MRPAVRIVFAPCGTWRSKDAPKGWSGERVARTIKIDPRVPHVGHTLLHELTHVRHPSWSETRVVRETARLWKRMTWKQKADLYRLLGTAE